jgi:hypothetical protein
VNQDLLALRFFKLQRTLPTLMRKKLNLLLVWEWMLVSENSRLSPLSFGAWRIILMLINPISPMLIKCLLKCSGMRLGSVLTFSPTLSSLM